MTMAAIWCLLFSLLALIQQAMVIAGVLLNSTALESIQIVALDGSARASFIPYGATATNFWVKDKKGVFRDILLGFDNHALYQNDDDGHPYFGPVVGRYANRIRGGKFTIPISKDASGRNKFDVPQNEGNNTLHGGVDGYDRRIWQTTSVSSNSVTFTLIDPNRTQGFPGTVTAIVTYTLKPKSTWDIEINAFASSKTPIMMSGHHYWNLEAYKESEDLLEHFAEFKASKFVATDGNLIPNGRLLDVKDTPMDFRTAKSIGASIPATVKEEFCGTGCVGFDNCWLFDEVTNKKAAFSMWNGNSGIRLDIFTNQPALQIYTCNGIFNASLPIPRKKSQGGPQGVYKDHSCVVIENESVIDAINNPEFGVDQIYGPGRPYTWKANYVFSTMH